MRGLRRDAIYFAAIAGGKNESLLENSSRTKLFRRPPRLLRGERHLLAHLHRCGPVIQSDENNLYVVARRLLKKSVVVRKIQIHHRKTEDYDYEIEDA